MESEKTLIQKEIVNSLPSPCHGLVNLAPRVGKTKIILDIVKRDKPKKILWVTPNVKLRDIDIPSEFKLWKCLSYFKKTDIICWASLANHKGEYDIIILDEYQYITESNVEPIFNGNITYKTIVGLSGTHSKHLNKLNIYEKLNLKILVSMSIDEAVEKNLIAPYNIEVIRCVLNSKDKDVKSGNATNIFYQTEEEKYAFMTRSIDYLMTERLTVPKYMYFNRMRFIYGLKSKNEFAKRFISKLKGRTLVFTGGIPQAELISQYTHHSKRKDTNDLDAFLAEKINVLSCVNSGGVGFTFRNVDNFVIVQVNSDQNGDATQKIARSLVLQEGYVANIYILCVTNTVEEVWVEKVLQNFNKEKVKYTKYTDYE